MEVMGLCRLCGKAASPLYSCRLCGAVMCGACLDAKTGLCKRCAATAGGRSA
jgi:hypothetical protein